MLSVTIRILFVYEPENPTKKSIIAAMGYLKNFSENFRDPKIIEKHAAEIMKLVENL